MNNGPVAWIDPYDLERLPHYDCHIGSQQLKNGIPLYTQEYINRLQAEIEALKMDIHSLTYGERLTKYFNKPVAWMREDGVIAFHKQKEVDSQGYKWIPLYTHPFNNNEPVGKVVQYDKNGSLEHARFGEPPPVETLLYTHPVKEHFEDEPQAEELHEILQSNTELTDEEIIRLAVNYFYFDDSYSNNLGADAIRFARAILRKASEK